MSLHPCTCDVLGMPGNRCKKHPEMNAMPIPAKPDEGTPVCRACNDTHMVWHESRGQSFMCTSCPTPCQKCRSGGNGPYCEKTPCDCPCHGKTNARTAQCAEVGVSNEQAEEITGLLLRAHACITPPNKEDRDLYGAAQDISLAIPLITAALAGKIHP